MDGKKVSWFDPSAYSCASRLISGENILHACKDSNLTSLSLACAGDNIEKQSENENQTNHGHFPFGLAFFGSIAQLRSFLSSMLSNISFKDAFLDHSNLEEAFEDTFLTSSELAEEKNITDDSLQWTKKVIMHWKTKYHMGIYLFIICLIIVSENSVNNKGNACAGDSCCTPGCQVYSHQCSRVAMCHGSACYR